MGKRKRRARQAGMWVATQDLPRSAPHPFYRRLNRVLEDGARTFDERIELRGRSIRAERASSPSVMLARGTETGEAPRWQGATTEYTDRI